MPNEAAKEKTREAIPAARHRPRRAWVVGDVG